MRATQNLASPRSRLLDTLLSRGDRVEVASGRLSISSASGRIVPDDWMEVHTTEILRALASMTEEPFITYEGYSTGRFSNRYPGVCLQFSGLADGAEYYAVFNADLTRARNTKLHKKGAPLPSGRFRVNKRSEFCKFWLRTGLRLPKLSVFHDYLGNLKKLVFTGEFREDGRISKRTLRPAEFSYAQVLALHRSAVSPDLARTKPKLLPDNSMTNLPDKDFASSQVSRGVQESQTACGVYCGASLKGGEVASASEYVIPGASFPPELQSVESWLEDYERAAHLPGNQN